MLIFRASTRPTVVGGWAVTGLLSPTGTLATPTGSDALTLAFGANESLAGVTGSTGCSAGTPLPAVPW